MGTSSLTALLLFYCYTFLGGLMPVAPNPVSDLVCHFVNCGQGNCTESKSFLLPFDCNCNAGWKKLKMGVLALPPCILPDCDLDFGCGSHSSFPPLSPPPVFNVTDPCSYTYCGDGTCLTKDETSYICNCTEGSANLLNSTSLPCLKQCAFQPDCKSLGFGGSDQSPQSPPSSPPLPPSSPVPARVPNATQSGYNVTGSMEYSSSRKYQAPGTIFLVYIVIFHVLGF